jgi:hypothetical protein
MFLYLSSVNTNGTNRLAIITQCVFAVAGFKEKECSRFPGQKTLPGLESAEDKRGQEDAKSAEEGKMLEACRLRTTLNQLTDPTRSGGKKPDDLVTYLK